MLRHADDVTLDHLIALRAENERLREILKRALAAHDATEYSPKLRREWVHDARAALKEGE